MSLVAMTALVVWGLARPGPSGARVSRFVITPPQTAPLANRPGFDVIISPDGSRIAYLAQADTGGRMLYVRGLGELETEPIPGTVGADDPFFSPDGDWIGFESPREGRLMKVALSGGPPLTIFDDPNTRGAVWGPDDAVIFARRDGLYRVPAVGGGTPERLSPEPVPGEIYGSPRVLPGARALVFSLTTGTGVEASHVAALSLETGERTLLTSGTNPYYAASGHLAFVRGTTLMAAPFDVERLQLTGDPVVLVEDIRRNLGVAADYALSDNGTLVYVPGGEALEARRMPVWVDRDGREEPLGLEASSYVNPRLSPDGARLAVQLLDANSNSDVWVYDLARKTPTRLTYDPAADSFPLWSPDGERVVFQSMTPERGLYWKRADGVGEKEVLKESPNPIGAFSWSRDGSLLVVSERATETGWDIHTLPMDGERTMQPLLQTPFDELRAVVSPDGQWLAYYSDESGEYEVYVQPFPNVIEGKMRISRDGGVSPMWGPDSRELFYRSGEAMMRVAVETNGSFSASSPETVFEGPYVPDITGVGRTYDIAPDGQRFLMFKTVAQAGERFGGRLVVVQNWFEELKERVPVP